MSPQRGRAQVCLSLLCQPRVPLPLSPGLLPHQQGSSRRFPSLTSYFSPHGDQRCTWTERGSSGLPWSLVGAWHSFCLDPWPQLCHGGGGKQMLPQCPAPSPNSGPPASQTKVGGWRRCSASASLAPRGMWAARRAPANEHLPSFHYVSCTTCAPALSGRPRGEVPWLLVRRVCRK